MSCWMDGGTDGRTDAFRKDECITQFAAVVILINTFLFSKVVIII